MAVTNILTGNTSEIIFLGLKIMYLIAIILYGTFAVLIVRQIYIMTGTLISSISARIKFLGWANLLLAVVVFVFALLVL